MKKAGKEKENFESNLNLMRIIISQHFASNRGPGHRLANYLMHCKEILCIYHPFDSMVHKPSFYEVYRNGEKIIERSVGSTHGPVVSYFRDFIQNIQIVIRQNHTYDLYIGIDPLNAFSGLILKYFNRTKKVIFYPIDYSPTRFKNNLLNWIYHYIETYCAKHSDKIWFTNKEIMEVFLEKGIEKRKCHVMLEQIEKIYPEDGIDRLKNPVIAYIGGLRPEKGVELIIDSLPKIIENNPNVKLLLIGSGPLEKKLKEKIKKSKLENCVTMTGYVQSYDEAMKRLAGCTIGLAPYLTDEELYTAYGYGSKVSEYMACGLPIIISHWKEIERLGIGITINHSVEDLTNAVKLLLNNKKLYDECRKKAYKMAPNYYYETVFDKAFSTINLYRL